MIKIKINNKYKIYGLYIFVFLLLYLIIVNMYFTFGNVSVKEWNLGEIATEDIIAPYTFDVLKPEDEYQKEQDEAANNVPAVLDYRKDISSSYLDSLNTFLDSILTLRTKRKITFYDKVKILRKQYKDFSEEVLSIGLRELNKEKADYIAKTIRSVYNRGIVSSKTDIPLGSRNQVSIRREGEEKIYSINDIFDIDEAYSYIRAKVYNRFGNQNIVKIIDAILSKYLRPNLFVNFDETTQRRESARASVSRKVGIVFKGEMIVRAHDQITKDVLMKLNSMKMVEEKKVSNWKMPIGRNILFIIFYVIAVLFFFYYRRDYVFNFRIIITIYILFAFIILTTLFLKYFSLPLYFTPIVILTLSLSLLLDDITAVVISLVFSFVIYIYEGMRFHTGLMFVVMSFIVVWSERKPERRREVYWVILWIFIFYLIYIIGDGLILGNSLSEMFKKLFGISIANISGIFFVLGIMPILEQISGKSTVITLLELSNLNHPLLKEMTIKAAGTYHHSIIVGSIAEAAAREIGANSLLVKVGSLFHDIGKMPRARYFIENLTMGKGNPHDNIPPWRSAQILISHVKDGEEMAKKYKLPKDVIDFIKEHHGTSLMEFFYDKAKKMDDGKKPVDEYIYRYPGPKPSSKETAIVMLADAVEAAVRSIDNPTPQKIIRTVEYVIKKKMDDGQLNDSHLTLIEIDKIKNSFIRMLNSIYHTRIKYPHQREEK